MSKCILLVDCQLLQTAAWDRGMGQYVLHLLEQIEKRANKIQVGLILNSNMPVDSKRVAHLQKICHKAEIIQWELPLAPSGEPTTSDEERYRAVLAELINAHYQDVDDISYLISAPFMFDFFALFPNGVRKLIMAYDLTPFLHWEDLGGYFPPELYLRRFKQMLEADIIYSISETTAADIIECLGVDTNRVVNIDGGYTGFDQKIIKPSIKLPKRYVLLPSADLPHKNNDVAVRGFYEFCKKTGWDGGLVVTSTFSEATRLWLSADYNEIVFSGNVPVGELNWLYMNASAVMFPSKYEGLGIPLLDAVANGKPAVASKIPVFLEMTKSGYYYFDPDNPSDAANALEDALIHRDSFEKRKGEYPHIIRRYTWERTAKRFLTALEEPMSSQNVAKNAATHPSNPMPRVAIVSDHPGKTRSMFSQVSERLYRILSPRAEVDYYFDPGSTRPEQMERPTFLNYMKCRVFDIGGFTIEAYNSYDVVIYLLEDGMFGRVAQKAAVLPGKILQPNTLTEPVVSLSLLHENQFSVKTISPEPTRQKLQEIADWILIEHKNEEISRRRSILKRHGQTRSIIKRLMEISNDS